MREKISILTVIIFILSLCGCTGETLSLTELPDPAVSVVTFFEYLEKEDYEAADALVYNYVTLGMTDSDRVEDPLMQAFCSELNRQRSYEVVMAPQVDGKNAIMTVKVTTLDLRQVYEPLIINVKETIKQMQYEGAEVDSEEAILEVATEEMKRLLSEDESITTSGIFALELVYSKGEWRLIISDELYSALIGYAV